MKLLLILAIIIGAVSYFAYNFSKYGTFLKSSGFKNVEIPELFTVGNLYGDKTICTKGYYIEAEGVGVLKESLDSDIYNKSIWINNQTGKEFFVDAFPGNKAALFKVCGKFEYGRGKGFGQPQIWNQQMIASDFEQLEKTVTLQGN